MPRFHRVLGDASVVFQAQIKFQSLDVDHDCTASKFYGILMTLCYFITCMNKVASLGQVASLGPTARIHSYAEDK